MTIKEIAIKKADQSICKFKVSAIGLNSKNEIVAKSVNRPRFGRKGGGIHAEIQIMHSGLRKNIKTIIICRINDNGKLLPIHPCKNCKKIADKLGIKIVSIF